MSKVKQNSLLFLSAAGILVMVLVMSLPTLDLFSGKSFTLGKTDVTLPGVSASIPGDDAFVVILRGIVALACVSFSIYLIYSLFSPKGRRRAVGDLAVLLLLLWFAHDLGERPFSREIEGGPQTQAEDTVELKEDLPSTPVLAEGHSPRWLTVVMILLVSGFGLGLVLVGASYLFQPQPKSSHPSLLALAEAAQDTLALLQGGGDFREAIIRCYYEMNRVVQEERGLARGTAMTPREFETYLVSRGLPPDALQTLTRLFERVRYGSLSSGAADETTAFACLKEIMNACTVVEHGQHQ